MVAGTKLRILRHPSLGDVANAGYAAAPSVMAAKGDALKHFSRAIVKASLLVRYHPAAAARALLTADGKPFGDADLARKTAELTFWEDDLPAADIDGRYAGLHPAAGGCGRYQNRHSGGASGFRSIHRICQRFRS